LKLYFGEALCTLLGVKLEKGGETMASYVPVQSRLNIRVQLGTDASGNPVLATLGIRDVDPAATADAVAAITQAIGGLLAYPVVDAYKVDTDEINTAA
jgi:hypothetical protein